ncbi:hypothetical protein RchiOBHm_Chr3g0470551 [Rosa chinensis]|uniref:Uncharacterized protein n=1 Tax=Rosa chinensis TaxID=74649 RepID=A0A2P6RB29_ROSCH|nr:hypothetical protein RchiOBHm_Chr3g0470551 [Rosa chinensis]
MSRPGCPKRSCQSLYVLESHKSSLMTWLDSMTRIVVAYNPLERHISFSKTRLCP